MSRISGIRPQTGNHPAGNPAAVGCLTTGTRQVVRWRRECRHGKPRAGGKPRAQRWQDNRHNPCGQRDQLLIALVYSFLSYWHYLWMSLCAALDF